jgi:ribosomal protein S18 acetylase RimI-like enzyme
MVSGVQLTLVHGRGAEQAADLQEPVHPLPVLIRRIDEPDLESIGRLYAGCYSPIRVADEASAIADMQASWHGQYGEWLRECSLVAEVDGRPVAAVLVVDSPPWDDVSDLVFIIELFTDPDHRRRGLGEALLTASLHAVGVDRVVGLRVDSYNNAAVSLYRNLGFGERTSEPLNELDQSSTGTPGLFTGQSAETDH